MRRRVALLSCRHGAPVLCLFSMLRGGRDQAQACELFPPTHMNSIMLGKYCEELNKKLAGKVEITQYTGGTLLTAPKMAAGVATGIADIGFSHCSYSQGTLPGHGDHGAAPRLSRAPGSRATWRTISMTSSSRRSGTPITPSCSARAPSTSSRH